MDPSIFKDRRILALAVAAAVATSVLLFLAGLLTGVRWVVPGEVERRVAAALVELEPASPPPLPEPDPAEIRLLEEQRMGAAIVRGARESMARAPRYDTSYVLLEYPGGDPGWERGTTADLVVRSLRAVGVDLQRRIHEAIRANSAAYGVTEPDPSVDHRRVRNVVTYLDRHSGVTGLDRSWRAGDIVVWNESDGSRATHLGIVSDRRGAGGAPLVIHHSSRGRGTPREEDLLGAVRVLGHYRWPLEEAILPPAPAVEPAPSGGSTAAATTVAVDETAASGESPSEPRDPLAGGTRRMRELLEAADPRSGGSLARWSVVDLDAAHAAPALRRADLVFGAARPIPETPFGRLIFEQAEAHSVNPRLVAAMVWVESRFDPQAVSPKGALGLMQVMPETGVRFGVGPDSLFDPRSNLRAGVRYLDALVERYDGDPLLVLGAYNAGEGAVGRYGDVPPFAETRTYVRRVGAAMRALGATGLVGGVR